MQHKSFAISLHGGTILHAWLAIMAQHAQDACLSTCA